ncbi:hypothetical protein GALL_439850 [mine drainage metagenome]|uniref:Uncharacterized protein n=1 Tax=mine drainage metagenome TaxID=410659 RepID=A0A1J5PS90_9ZZZZ
MFERDLQRRQDILLPEPRPRDSEVGVDRGAPVHIAGVAPERDSALQLFDRLFVQAEIEQEMADELIGDELKACLLETLEPAQGLLHTTPGLAIAARARPGMIESEQRRPNVPLQVCGTRDVERRLEVCHGARVVAEPLGPEAGVPDHHQVLGLVALVTDAAGQFERPGVARDRRIRLRVREVRLAAAVPGLHRDEIGATRALADLDRLLMEPNSLVVLSGAPRNCPKVIEGIGGVVLVVHCTGIRQRFGEARGRFFIGVRAPVGHAQLDQRVTRLFAFAAGAQLGDHPAHVGNGALSLSGLRARLAAPRVDREALPCVQ